MAIIKKFYITKFKKERPKIELKNVSVSFKKRQILDNISFLGLDTIFLQGSSVI